MSEDRAICDFCGKELICVAPKAFGVIQCRECFRAMISETLDKVDVEKLTEMRRAAAAQRIMSHEEAQAFDAALDALPALIEEIRKLRKFNDDGHADWLLKKHRVTELEFENAELRKEIEWRTSESATFRRERDEAREEIAELRKFKDKVRALDRLQQKDWDEPGIELAVQQLEDEIADEVRK